MSLAGQGLGGGGGEAESQLSQASLFASEPASSLELFSEPAYSSLSCPSQHSQNDVSSHHLSSHSLNDGQSQDEGRGIQNVQLDRTSGLHQSQGHNKYYMRYLSAMSLGKAQQQQQAEGPGLTPLRSRQGDTAHSKVGFERWKLKQQDRLEKQKLIEEVVSLSSSGYTKELKVTLENLRKDIKEALSSQTSNNQVEKTQLQEAGLTQDLLSQLTLGQAEIREQLSHLGALGNQQKRDVAALKLQVSTLGEHLTSTIQSTLSTEVARLEETAVKPCLHRLEVQVSELSAQLRTHRTLNQSRLVPPPVREVDSGSPPARIPPVTTNASVPKLNASMARPCDADNDAGVTGQPRSSQIQRKRKGQSVTRDRQPMSSRTKEDSRPQSRATGGGGQLALSQSSTDDLSTPCDIDLTQHSPLGCSQVIADNIQRLRKTSASSKPASQQKRVPKTRPSVASSPPLTPTAKRKRQIGRVSKQRGSAQRGKGLATPRVTRRSQRLSKLSVPQPAAPSEQLRPNHGIKQEAGTEKEVNTEGGGLGGNWTSGDVLDDWLDFRPPHPLLTQTSASVKPVSRFQRSSEAARRKLAVTEQMSSALAASDSVLRELFSSAPSILSP